MDNPQQPECPAEFAWMKPGIFADDREYQIVQIMELPAIEQGEWRVRCQYTTDTFGYLPCADLVMYGGDSEFNHVCARLAESEARANAAEEKLAQVKVLLDGVEVQKALKNLTDLLDFEDPAYIYLWLDCREQMPALLSAITEVQEVLKGG